MLRGSLGNSILLIVFDAHLPFLSVILQLHYNLCIYVYIYTYLIIYIYHVLYS